MDPEKEIQSKFLQSALKHRLISPKKALEVQSKCGESDDAKEMAIRLGAISAQKLDILDALENPQNVVRGYELLSLIHI